MSDIQAKLAFDHEGLQERRQRLDWLDGLRALAIILVVLHHAALAYPSEYAPLKLLSDAGQYGVQLFFVISAATVYLTLRRGGSIWSWWARRYFRIAPLYYLAILFYGVWRYALPTDDNPSVLLWAAAAGANAVFLHGFVPPAINSVVPGGWSIAAEMTFYAVAPFIVMKLLSTGRLAVLGLVVTALVLTAIQQVIGGGVAAYAYRYWWPLAHLPVFFVALAAIHLWRDHLFGSSVLPQRMVVTGAVIMGVGLTGGLTATVYEIHPASILLMGIGFTGLLLIARAPWRPLFETRIATAIGRVSYSIYVTHFALLRLWPPGAILPGGFDPSPTLGTCLRFLFALIGAYGVSVLTYRYIETPGNQLGRRISKQLQTKPLTTA